MKTLVLLAILAQAEAPPSSPALRDANSQAATERQPKLSKGPASPPNDPATLTGPEIPASKPTKSKEPKAGAGFWAGFFAACVLGILAIIVVCALSAQNLQRRSRLWDADRIALRRQLEQLETENESLRDTIVRKVEHVFSKSIA